MRVDELGNAALEVAVQLGHEGLALALGTVLATNLSRNKSNQLEMAKKVNRFEY